MAVKDFLKNISLDDLFKNFFQSFYKWRMNPHPHHHLEQADIIIALSFGGGEDGPGETNAHLARILEDLHGRYQLPIISQWEIATDTLIEPQNFLLIVRPEGGE